MDTSILYWVNGHHTPFLDHFFWELSLAAQFYLIWIAFGAFAVLFDKKNGVRVMLLLFVTLVLTSASVELLLKPLLTRPRPFITLGDAVRNVSQVWGKGSLVSEYSLPSGHCASSAAAAWILGSFYRRLRWPLAVLVALIAYSRMYLGVHYFSDCIAGLAVGVLCAVAAKRSIGGLAHKKE